MEYKEQEFCQKIKHLRELRNFTQAYMAQVLGISTRAYSKLEQGSTQLTLKRLFQISEVLGISVKEILGFSTELVFNNNPQRQSGGQYVAYNNTAVEQVKELYERLLEAKDIQITMLQKNQSFE